MLSNKHPRNVQVVSNACTVSTYFKKVLCAIIFTVVISTSYSQVRVDGILREKEWAIAGKTSVINLNFGKCYYLLQNDTLFFAFDVIADNMDNNPVLNRQVDKVYVYIDSKGNDTAGPVYSFIGESINNSGYLQKTCTGCEAKKAKDISPAKKAVKNSRGIYATGFDVSVFFKEYKHRTWELAIPVSELPSNVQLGFACRVTSVYPRFSESIFIEKETKAFRSLLKMENNRMAIVPQQNIPSSQPGLNPSEVVTGRRILDNGRVEISYADGHKRIEYEGGFTIIAPDGRVSKATLISVPTYIPPALPDANTNKWLESINVSLLGLISAWVGNDAQSITSMKNVENGKNIYEVINMRFRAIDYLNPLKK